MILPRRRSAMRILGVDPGSRAAGWAVVDFTAAPVLVAAGVLRPSPRGELRRAPRVPPRRPARRSIAARRPEAAAVERVFSGVNPQSLISLGEARGVLLLALAQAGVSHGRGDARRDQARRGGLGRRREGAGAPHGHRPPRTPPRARCRRRGGRGPRRTVSSSPGAARSLAAAPRRADVPVASVRRRPAG